MLRKKIIALVLAFAVLINITPLVAVAQEAPTAPEAPQAPAAESAPTPPPQPETPSQESQPTPPPAPTTPPAASDQAREDARQAAEEERKRQIMEQRAQQATGTPSPSSSPAATTTTTPGTSGSGAGTGATTIKTGDATATTSLITTGNNNAQASSPSGSSGGSIQQTGNGAGSNQNSSIQGSNTTNTQQNNTANVNNTLNQGVSTGTNDASMNMGDTTILSGQANSSATIFTAVNTNAAGIGMAEFNVVDNHTGDLVLDFSNAQPATVNTGTNSSTIENNGANSQSATEVESLTQDNSFQNNDATIENNLTLSADTGNNTANLNTNGNTTIETGDANLAANVVTFANNNIEGNILFGVVNIFGNLTGDIVLPESAYAPSGSTSGSATPTTTATMTNNGAGSDNSSQSTSAQSDATFQSNTAEIENEIIIDTNTGNNDASYNTNGNTTISSGDSNVMASTLNIANNNITTDQPIWIVLINEMGNWTGEILGLPEGQNLGASEGINATVTPAQVSINGNGADTVNAVNQQIQETNEAIQNNNATIKNTLNLSANTGNNQASYNTNGNTTIRTGDTNVIANLVNFVNNNIVAPTGQKVIVTLINVFGSWNGNFRPPGATPKPTSAPAAQTATGSTAPTPQPVVQTNSSNNSTNSQTHVQQRHITQTAHTARTVTTNRRPLPRRTTRLTYANVPTILGSTTEEEKEEEINSPTGESDALLTPTPEANDKKVLRVNLAWSVFGLPVVGVLAFLRKLLFQA